MTAIKKFPRLGTTFKMYVFIKVVEKVAGPFLKLKDMLRFKGLVCPEAMFSWSHDLEETFNRAKTSMMDRVRSGTATFNPRLLLSTGLIEEEAEWLRCDQLAI